MCQPRLSRCLRLLTMLQSRIGHSARDLANDCQVSKRTIYRDLCLMAQSGIPVYYDAKRRGYILQTHSNVCASGLPGDELTALLLAAHIFSLSCELEVSRPIHQAIGKLLAQAPAALREEIAGLLKSVGGKPSTTLWPQGARTVVAEILMALRQKGHIRIVYQPSDESAPPLQTKVTPHQLVVAQGNWYLVGRSSWHCKVCRFDLRHIRRAERIEDTTVPVELSVRHAHARNPRLIPVDFKAGVRGIVGVSAISLENQRTGTLDI